MGNLDAGRLFIFAGLILVILGFLFTFRSHIPWLGKLPGDILIRRDAFTFYFPIVTCILLSLLVSAIFLLLKR
jgi:hypothetical protein